MLPSDFAPWQTVYYYFRKWKLEGVFEEVMDALHSLIRKQAGREESPSLGIMDSRSVKTSHHVDSDRGIDGNKKIKGRKEHIIVDTLGLPLAVAVHKASLHDSKGAPQAIEKLAYKFTLLMLSLFLYVTGQAQTVEKRIYTQAELKAAQEREEQKRTEEVQDSILFVEAVKSLEKLDFVVEADKLIFKHGETAYVTSNTNFFSLSDDQAVVQIAPFNSGGPNGVGGITLEGRASNIKMKTDKKGNISFSMSPFKDTYAIGFCVLF